MVSDAPLLCVQQRTNSLSGRHNSQHTMLKRQAALEINIERVTARTISAQLDS